MEEQIFIGQLIYAQLKESGKTVTWLAENLSYHRFSIFKIFRKKCLNTDLLSRISTVMEYDFFTHFSEEVKCKIAKKKKNKPQ
jgi:hypothetical protein